MITKKRKPVARYPRGYTRCFKTGCTALTPKRRGPQKVNWCREHEPVIRKMKDEDLRLLALLKD